jgi:hypothetical protein
MTTARKFIDCLDDLHAAAVDLTGLSDFGDGAYREGLSMLLQSLDERPRPDERVREAAMRQVGLPLKGRLFAQKGWKDHPEALLRPTPAPLVIVGAPRSGTTALHQLLAADPLFQGLECWLCRQPMVRPPREAWATNPVFQREAQAFDAMLAANPQLRAMHAVGPEEVDECIVPMAQSFVSNLFGSTLDVPAYDAWFIQQDIRPSYRRYADILKLVGLDSEKPWLLKNPSHILYLNELLEVFPDAKVVQIHRDPLKTIPSTASLLYNLQRRVATDTVDPKRVGRREFTLWQTGLSRSLEAAARHPNQILGVKEDELLSDPVALAGRIYAFAGLPFTAQAESRLAQWAADNPKGKVGSHVYTAEQFGLSDGELREAFAGYRAELGFA